MLSPDVCLSHVCDECFDIVVVRISCKVMLHSHCGCGCEEYKCDGSAEGELNTT